MCRIKDEIILEQEEKFGYKKDTQEDIAYQEQDPDQMRDNSQAGALYV